MSNSGGESPFDLQAGDGYPIEAYRWQGTDAPRAVVQIAHGMGEHSLRYDRLGRALSAAGIDLLAVDQRGHGRTAAMAGTPLGALGSAGWDGLVADFALVVRSTRQERPEIPIVVLGHSMGSWVVQQFLQEHSAEVVGAVLSGTAALEMVLAGVDPDQELDLTAFNAPFEGSTGYEWLSRDPAGSPDTSASRGAASTMPRTPAGSSPNPHIGSATYWSTSAGSRLSHS